MTDIQALQHAIDTLSERVVEQEEMTYQLQTQLLANQQVLMAVLHTIAQDSNKHSLVDIIKQCENAYLDFTHENDADENSIALYQETIAEYIDVLGNYEESHHA